MSFVLTYFLIGAVVALLTFFGCIFDRRPRRQWVIMPLLCLFVWPLPFYEFIADITRQVLAAWRDE